MTTVNEPVLADTGSEIPNQVGEDHVGDESIKRKAAPEVEDNAHKRPRRDDADLDRNAPPSVGAAENQRAQDGNARANNERRVSSVQEEKKRNKRLFGGLLNTLSHTTANPHQKRRQEIERRQQERLQQQQAEDDQKRADKAARLRNVRMAQQIVWDEEVMRNKHSKLLDQARYLQTKAKPHIHYLPWKLSDEQQDIIDEQIRQAHAIIDKDLDEFDARKQHHVERYGPRRRTSGAAKASVEPPAAAAAPVSGDGEVAHNVTESPQQETAQTKAVSMRSEDHHHDDSGDVMVEAGEDMVIY